MIIIIIGGFIFLDDKASEKRQHMTGTYTALPGDIRRRRRDQHTTAEFSAFKPPPKSKGIEKIIVDELQNHNFRLE